MGWRETKPELVVSREPVVATSLDVDGDEVEADPGALLLPVDEQFPVDAGGEVGARVGTGGVTESGQTHDDVLGVVDQGGLEEQVLQGPGHHRGPGAGAVRHRQVLRDHAVAEPEGRRGEGVGDRGVQSVVVLLGLDYLGHDGVPQYEGEVLGVGDVLQLRHQDVPRLLEQLLLPPGGVGEGEAGGQPVVFPHPDCVVECQAGLLVNSPVTGLETQAGPQLTLSATGRLQQRV